MFESTYLPRFAERPIVKFAALVQQRPKLGCVGKRPKLREIQMNAECALRISFRGVDGRLGVRSVGDKRSGIDQSEAEKIENFLVHGGTHAQIVRIHEEFHKTS